METPEVLMGTKRTPTFYIGKSVKMNLHHSRGYRHIIFATILSFSYFSFGKFVI